MATKRVAKHGGKYLSRTATHEIVEGSTDPLGLGLLLNGPLKMRHIHL